MARYRSMRTAIFYIAFAALLGICQAEAARGAWLKHNFSFVADELFGDDYAERSFHGLASACNYA